jgi:hypothetical protein
MFASYYKHQEVIKNKRYPIIKNQETYIIVDTEDWMDDDMAS